MVDQETENQEADARADCYSGGEREAMIAYQGFKQKWLMPLLVVLDKIGITPNQITLLSTLLGIAFLPLLIYCESNWTLHLAFWLLFAHLMIDGIDGPLARFQKIASPAGSFTDTFGDQIVVATTCIGMMIGREGGPTISIFSGGTHIFLYTSVVAMAMVRNAMKIPYSTLIRPRNFVYGWYWMVTFFLCNTFMNSSTTWFVWACNVVLLIKFFTGFWHIRNELAKNFASQQI